MKKKDILSHYGWTVESETPCVIVHADGSMASRSAADIVVEALLQRASFDGLTVETEEEFLRHIEELMLPTAASVGSDSWNLALDGVTHDEKKIVVLKCATAPGLQLSGEVVQLADCVGFVSYESQMDFTIKSKRYPNEWDSFREALGKMGLRLLDRIGFELYETRSD